VVRVHHYALPLGRSRRSRDGQSLVKRHDHRAVRAVHSDAVAPPPARRRATRRARRALPRPPRHNLWRRRGSGQGLDRRPGRRHAARSSAASSTARRLSSIRSRREASSAAPNQPPRHRLDTLSSASLMARTEAARPPSATRSRQGAIQPRPARAQASVAWGSVQDGIVAWFRLSRLNGAEGRVNPLDGLRCGARE
jgi:hypothetical protein